MSVAVTTAAPGSAAAMLPVVLDVVRAVTERREQLADVLKRTLRQLLPADWFAGMILEPEGQMSAVFIEPPIELPSPRISDYYGAAILDRLDVVAFTDAQLAAFPIQGKLWEELGVHAGIAIPLLAENRLIGGLSFWSKDVHAYERADREMLGLLGRAVGVALDNQLALERLERLRAQAADDRQSLIADAASRHASDALIGEHPAFRAIKQQVDRVGPTASTVLIVGESGTGKELVARAIHAASPRRERPFVVVNCAALPLSLVESELFGHEQGAFTGASKRRQGRFELAHEGTLFLDEVGELPLETQAKLLRGLQERRFERVGGSDTLSVDVRIVAATNRDLQALVAERRFREDLYYRLAVFPIRMPPLRERRPDIPRLAEYFIARAAERLRAPQRSLGEAGLARLMDYDWPGNIRELQNAIERAMIVSTGAELNVEALLPASVVSSRKQAATIPPPVASAPDGSDRDAALLREYQRTLEECQWVIEGPGGAAARLGVHPNTLRYRLKRLGIARPPAH